MRSRSSNNLRSLAFFDGYKPEFTELVALLNDIQVLLDCTGIASSHKLQKASTAATPKLLLTHHAIIGCSYAVPAALPTK